jgi:hypothetical protein
MTEKFIDIFKKNLFEMEPKEGFKKMDDKGWELFEKSGGSDVLAKSIGQFMSEYEIERSKEREQIPISQVNEFLQKKEDDEEQIAPQQKEEKIDNHEGCVVQINNLYRALNDARKEGEDARKLNNRFAEAVKLYTNAKAQPIDAYRACTAVLMMHEGAEIA